MRTRPCAAWWCAAPTTSLYTFRESVQKHFVASVSTCENGAKLRDKMLSDFWRYTPDRRRRRPQGAGEGVHPRPPRRHLGGRQARAAARRTGAGGEARPRRIQERRQGVPRLSYVVSLWPSRASAWCALCSTLISPMEQDFLKEQERRRKRKLPDEIYDVTGWSLPLLYNVESVAAAEASQGDFEILKAGPPPAGKVQRPRRGGLSRSLGNASRRALPHRGPAAGPQGSVGQQGLHASRPQVPHRHAHRAGEGERRGGA